MKLSENSRITVTFKQKNGEMWDEHYSYKLIDILKKCNDVFEIRITDTDEIIYRREN